MGLYARTDGTDHNFWPIELKFGTWVQFSGGKKIRFSFCRFLNFWGVWGSLNNSLKILKITFLYRPSWLQLFRSNSRVAVWGFLLLARVSASLIPWSNQNLKQPKISYTPSPKAYHENDFFSVLLEKGNPSVVRFAQISLIVVPLFITIEKN